MIKFSSALKNQLRFNKMIETQLAQVAAAILFSEKINAVTMRGGKSTHDPPHPNHVGKASAPQEEERLTASEDTREPVKTAPTSTTTTTGIDHRKEARGGTSHVHHSRKVITIILLTIRISIRTNLP